MRGRERASYHPLVHSLNALIGLRNSVPVSQVGGRNPITRATTAASQGLDGQEAGIQPRHSNTGSGVSNCRSNIHPARSRVSADTRALEVEHGMEVDIKSNDLNC